MKRTTISALLLVALLALAGTAVAAKPPKPAKPPKAQPTPHHSKSTVTTTAVGCAGNPWATETLQRKVKVHRNADGSYRVKLEDKGTFVTLAGVSPGNCPQNTSRHGTTVSAGNQGKVKGSMTGTVTGGVYNPAAFPASTCTAAAPCTTAVYVAALFGPSAQFTCLGNSTDCKSHYKYNAKKNNALLYRKFDWKSSGAGTAVTHHIKGDVANA